jgi:hypothetical protein
VVEPDPHGKRGKVVRLPPLGVKAQQNYRLTGEILNRWEAKFGKGEIGSLRGCLQGLIGPTMAAGLLPPAGVVRAGALQHYPLSAMQRYPHNARRLPLVLNLRAGILVDACRSSLQSLLHAVAPLQRGQLLRFESNAVQAPQVGIYGRLLQRSFQ